MYGLGLPSGLIFQSPSVFSRRGISPVIATVIIVAVAIAISIAVAGWLFGLWPGFTDYEALTILPVSYADATNDQVVLIVRNDGTKTAVVQSVQVESVTITLNTPQQIEPNQVATITVDIPTDNQGNPVLDIEVGKTYKVTVITSANVYVAEVLGK